ncbi:Vesicular inhibitory amino acid transporter [Exaiptasia diaphana]|nr:Vesicular inhibitory amino acid transporter [Exaiptasia diaphana]
MIICCVTQYKLMSIDKIPPFSFKDFPVGFGIIVFSYTAHAVFPGIESSMKEPHKYPLMMNGSFTFAAVIKVLLGLLAVLVFGTKTNQVITVNMKTSFVFNILANLFVISNVFLIFPINLYVTLETVDAKFLGFFPNLGPGRKFHWVWLIITRTLVMTLALFFVILVPHFALLKWNELQWYDIAVRWFVIVFGFVSGGLGVFFSGKRLLEVRG